MNSQPLSCHDVFSFLQPEQVKAISDVSEVISFAEGETVFRSGESAPFLYAVLEGQVSLDLPHGGDTSSHIENLSTGALFGSCVCFDLNTYTLTATSAANTKLLKINADQLKRAMDDDPATGYHVQRMISKTYFTRYLDAVKKS